MIFAIPLSFFVGAVFCILANKKITAKKIAITFALINFALCFQGNFVNNNGNHLNDMYVFSF